jgi:hypothetical protein
MHDPAWWPLLRRIVIFVLGCAVMIDALLQNVTSIGELVIGLIMVGVLPIDDLFRLVRRGQRRDDADG